MAGITTMPGSQIRDESITEKDIKDGSVFGSTANTAGTQREIVQGTVSTPDFRAGAVAAADVATGAFGGILSATENTVQKALDKIDDAYTKSITVSAGKLELVGDSAAPGNNTLYGCNSSGVRGWYTTNAIGTSGKTVLMLSFSTQMTNNSIVSYYNITGAGTATIQNFIFNGTNFYGTINTFASAAYATTAVVAGFDHYVQWYDETNVRVIAQVLINSTSATNIATTSSFVNAPSTGVSKCSIRVIIPATNARAIYLSASGILN